MLKNAQEGKGPKMEGNLLKGLTRKRLSGDSGMRPDSGSVDASTVHAVPMVKAPGGRNA